MEIPRHWRLKAQRYRLEGFVCRTCAQFLFPPRQVCPFCADKMGRNADWIFLVMHCIYIELLIKNEFTEKMIQSMTTSNNSLG
jgi:hypothetical protein